MNFKGVVTPAFLGDSLMLDRREFVKRGTVAAAMFGLPLTRAEEAFGHQAPRLPASEALREHDYPWFGYEENRTLRELRDALAAFFHCRRDELALVRNATEGNNLVCNGLDMKPGDEVLLTDQEHPGGRCCWEQKAARFGIKLAFVTLPRPPASADEIVERFRRAL